GNKHNMQPSLARRSRIPGQVTGAKRRSGDIDLSCFWQPIEQDNGRWELPRISLLLSS
ncbi:hypothetical protein AVEN_192462-1, partial [Araneus ventricosus]